MGQSDVTTLMDVARRDAANGLHEQAIGIVRAVHLLGGISVNVLPHLMDEMRAIGDRARAELPS